MADGSVLRCDVCDDDDAELSVPSASPSGQRLHLCESCLEMLFRKVMSERVDAVTLN